MKKIISKYINNEAKDAEINKLIVWLEKKENLKVFKEYLKINYLLREGVEFTNTTPIDSHNLLYPIPQFEIESSGGVVTQNPGY